mmetsp:Transcript_30226/g.96527  ORF Transcript_30226/g.96527 Transcript_30226/m.96527 type:complete len:395 (-) Transcript_30226:203-1387(-)
MPSVLRGLVLASALIQLVRCEPAELPCVAAEESSGSLESCSGSAEAGGAAAEGGEAAEGGSCSSSEGGGAAAEGEGAAAEEDEAAEGGSCSSRGAAGGVKFAEETADGVKAAYKSYQDVVKWERDLKEVGRTEAEIRYMERRVWADVESHIEGALKQQVKHALGMDRNTSLPTVQRRFLKFGPVYNPALDRFLAGMQHANETFDGISYHISEAVVLRGWLARHRAVVKAIPDVMTDCFRHHWIELHSSDNRWCLRSPDLCKGTEAPGILRLHMMDRGMAWALADTGRPGQSFAVRRRIQPAQVAAVFQARANKTYNHILYNCQDVAFDVWTALVPATLPSDGAGIPSPTQTKISSAAVDSFVIILLVLLARASWRSVKRERHALSDPLLAAEAT